MTQRLAMIGSPEWNRSADDSRGCMSGLDPIFFAAREARYGPQESIPTGRKPCPLTEVHRPSASQACADEDIKAEAQVRPSLS
jgi:hypothetical protein